MFNLSPRHERKEPLTLIKVQPILILVTSLKPKQSPAAFIGLDSG